MRADSYKEGSLAQIARLFIKPILNKMPLDADAKDWLVQMLGINEREVVRYRVRQGFRMPGVRLEQPHVKRPAGVQVPKGSILWVRTDVRTRDEYYVEVTSSGAVHQVFLLNGKNWGTIKPLLYRLRKREL